MIRGFDKHWYTKSPVGVLLAPAAWLFCLAVIARRGLYRLKLIASHRLDVPVIVVGNITAGGTGKTPLVIKLVQLLRDAGYTPAVVGRGYGGTANHWPQQVRVDSDPAAVGDEAVLIAARCRCPVAVAPDRLAAARSLVEHTHCDVIISDDGLQHYAMARDIEIAVIDGVRRFGNGRCLPAGPLREPRRRLRKVDYIVTNGLAGAGEYAMTLSAAPIRSVRDHDTVADARRFDRAPVHAVAGIGNPARFFSQLKALGLRIMEHPFPDHYRFLPEDIAFGDAAAVLMTEKDAVKCRQFAGPQHWFLPVDAHLDDQFTRMLLDHLARVTRHR